MEMLQSTAPTRQIKSERISKEHLSKAILDRQIYQVDDPRQIENDKRVAGIFNSKTKAIKGLILLQNGNYESINRFVQVKPFGQNYEVWVGYSYAILSLESINEVLKTISSQIKNLEFDLDKFLKTFKDV